VGLILAVEKLVLYELSQEASDWDLIEIGHEGVDWIQLAQKGSSDGLL
jgi:hypothetical protein